jgi:MATE family multidrug resistance protein
MPASTVTHARVFAIAGPMTLANLTTPLLGVVGTAVIGNLGEAHLLGAVAISAVVFDSIFWLFGFLRMGTVALTAQALGARDRPEQDAVLARALMVAAALGLALIALQVPLARLAYAFMGASPEVTRAAEIYFYVRIWGAPFALGNYVILGWLLGLGRATATLALQICVNLINIAMTIWLVLGLNLGVAGAALATLIAEGAGCLIGLAVTLRLMAGRPGASIVFDRDKLVRLFAVNRDMMLRSAAAIIAFAFFAAQGARAGDTVLAANSVLNNLILVGVFFLDGFATAAEQLCGHAVGARDRTAFLRATKLILGWGFAFGVAVSLVMLTAGPWLIALMTVTPAVRVAAGEFLLLAAAAPAVGVFAFAYDGIYAGATWTRDMRNLMLAAVALYFAVWWATTPYGNSGLWLAFLTFFAARGIMQAARYPALVRETFGGMSDVRSHAPGNKTDS